MIGIKRLKNIDIEDSVFQQTAAACFAVVDLQEPCCINLTLTDDEDIKAINREWRGLDSITDVISFPSLDLSPHATFRADHPSSLSAWDCDKGAFFLGDIVINVEQAKRQAAEYNHPVSREILYLFVHGIFHLLGYDHISKEDQLTMREQEEKALQAVFSQPVSDIKLLESAREARATAYTPYSNYRVGAALLGKNGQVYTGCNIENASFGLTNCAERTAVFKAVSEGQNAFDTIAIAADQTPPWPCGACRQVLSEFAPRLRVIITWGSGETAESTLDQLLPHSFLNFQEDQNG